MIAHDRTRLIGGLSFVFFTATPPDFSRIIGTCMKLFDWLKPSPPLDAATLARITQSVRAVDPLIAQVSGHERILAPTIECAWDYCERVALAIPGPFVISHAAFAADPLVHALFGSADDIQTMLATSQCVREHLDELTATGQGHCCAILGMRVQIAAGFGVRMAGDVLQRDEPRKTLSFADHTLTEPGRDIDEVHHHLAATMFTGLLQGFADHVAEARAQRQGLHNPALIQRTLARAANPESHTRRLPELQERLRASDDALQPRPLLAALAEYLAAPQAALSIDPMRLWVDRCGVIAEDPDERAQADALRFVELRARDLRRWVVMVVKIERAEARAAVEHFEARRRYIVI